MGLLDSVRVNIFEVVSPPCTANWISLPHPTDRTKHNLSSIKKQVERTEISHEDLAKNLSIVDLMFYHESCFSMSFKVMFRSNVKKSNQHAGKIRSLM